MKYLVTGGAGFIGSHLVESLLHSGYEVVVIDDLSSGKLDNIENREACEIYIQSVQDTDVETIEGLDGIFHFAAQASVPVSVEEFYVSSKNNVLSSIKVFDAARKLKLPVVYASSSAIYGELEVGDDTSHQSDLNTPYAVDKFTLENYAKVAHSLYKVPSVGLRLFNIYGPKQDPSNPYSGVISIFAKQVSLGERVTVNGGYQTRDFVYVKDAVRIVEKSMQMLRGKNICEIVNLCTGRSVTIDWLLDSIIEIIDEKPEISYCQILPGDPKRSSGTFDKMVNLFNLDLNDFTRLKDGLKQTIEYFNKRY